MPFKNLFDRVYSKTTIKMKAYTAVQKKLLVMIYTLWKKDEAFNESYNNQLSGDEEMVSSFASAPKEPLCKKILKK